MARNRKTTSKHTLTWRSVLIDIHHTPKYFGWSDHVEVIVRKPKGAKLPITDTGYLSHFIDPEELATSGGPVMFVQDWLEREASTKAWRRAELKAAQLDFLGLLTPKPRRHRSSKIAARS